MNHVPFFLGVGGGSIICLGFVYFSWVSYFEKELRAARVALGFAAFSAAIFFIPALVFPNVLVPFLCAFGFLLLLAGVLFLGPLGKMEPGFEPPQFRIDERDIMFARKRLNDGSPEFHSYYQLRPENRSTDDAIRAKPGLLNPKASLYHLLGAKTANASFEIPEALRGAVDGPVAEDQVNGDIEKLSDYLRHATLYFGARKVGFCELKPYHFYSHIGRGSGEYGAPIEMEHTHAIAFSLEMDFDHVATAPGMPITMESARQYGAGADIAVQLAALIRSFGYSARAHIDGNYRVVAPLVARDAGLGELGRIGLLITPDLGPRVRLGIVTTSFPVGQDQVPDGNHVIHFCEICKKCAANCPSRSISSDSRKEERGVTRWQINQETCFRYWCLIGTDCGKCVAVCPFSHPDNKAHNLMRWAIKRSGFARHMALWMDDLFYGRKPPSKSFPGWIPE